MKHARIDAAQPRKTRVLLNQPIEDGDGAFHVSDISQRVGMHHAVVDVFWRYAHEIFGLCDGFCILGEHAQHRNKILACAVIFGCELQRALEEVERNKHIVAAAFQRGEHAHGGNICLVMAQMLLQRLPLLSDSSQFCNVFVERLLRGLQLFCRSLVCCRSPLRLKACGPRIRGL